MFTQNSREAIRTLPFFRGFFRWVYEKTRLPLVPIYGLFPVKLRTYIGRPIEYDSRLTALDLKNLVIILSLLSFILQMMQYVGVSD
jgi:hypothetical protein